MSKSVGWNARNNLNVSASGEGVPSTPAADTMSCGHPITEVQSGDEGTNYCRACQREAAADKSTAGEWRMSFRGSEIVAPSGKRFSISNPALVAEINASLAALREQLATLEQWKREQMEVSAETRYEEIAKEIGVPFGHSKAQAILPAIVKLKSELAEALHWKHEFEKDAMRASLQLAEAHGPGPLSHYWAKRVMEAQAATNRLVEAARKAKQALGFVGRSLGLAPEYEALKEALKPFEEKP